MSDSFVTPWTAARQASPSFTISWSLWKLLSIALVMPSHHLILCRLLVAQMVRLPVMQETWVGSLGQDVSLEKVIATYSSILAWRIPWTEEPGRLQSSGVAESRTWLSDFPILLVGLYNGLATLESSLAVSLKDKHAATIWSSSYTVGHLSWKNENLQSHKHLYMSIDSSFIFNSQNLESA